MIRRRSLAAVAAALSLAACGGGGTEAPSNPLAAVAGTYTLRTADGAPVPVVVDRSASGTIEVVTEALTLEANGTWTRATVDRITIPAPSLPGGVAVSTQSLSDGGAWTMAGSALTLTSTATGIVFPAAIAGAQITSQHFNKSFVYAR